LSDRGETRIILTTEEALLYYNGTVTKEVFLDLLLMKWL
jgi:hypothetical protein